MKISIEELVLAIGIKERGFFWKQKAGDFFAHHVHIPEYEHLSYFSVGQLDENGDQPDDDEYDIYDEDTWLPTVCQIQRLFSDRGVDICYKCDGNIHNVCCSEEIIGVANSELGAYYNALLNSFEQGW